MKNCKKQVVIKEMHSVSKQNYVEEVVPITEELFFSFEREKSFPFHTFLHFPRVAGAKHILFFNGQLVYATCSFDYWTLSWTATTTQKCLQKYWLNRVLWNEIINMNLWSLKELVISWNKFISTEFMFQKKYEPIRSQTVHLL